MIWSIEELEAGDVALARKMIKSSTSVDPECDVEEELDAHLDSVECVAKKLVVNGKMVGVYALQLEDDYLGISFMYINEDIRKSWLAFRFCKDLLWHAHKDKPVYLIAKDVSTFKNYVVHVENDMYELVGLR